MRPIYDRYRKIKRLIAAYKVSEFLSAQSPDFWLLGKKIVHNFSHKSLDLSSRFFTEPL